MNPAASAISTRPIDLDPLSPQNIDLVKTWIHECTNIHPQCPRPEPATLPRRVIDVRDLQGDESRVKLYISNNDLGSYVALSYCWGGPQTYSLTTKTIESFQKGIELCKLPATIRDAIRVTKLIKQPYLWVDALCIVQDSDDDKEEDIAQMHEIYSNAIVTISATTANNCQGGFLAQQSSIHDSPILVPYMCPTGEYGCIQLRHYLQVNNQEALEQRAWALQERCLSPRVLAFRSVLWWQCSEVHYGQAQSEEVMDADPWVSFPALFRSRLEGSATAPLSVVHESPSEDVTIMI